MKIADWLKQSQTTLKDAGISTARLDCLVLLEDSTRKNRAWLLSHAEEQLQIEMVEKLNTKIVQRAQHMPLAYIRGKAEFYGREFAVNEHTLVPRPETETMIELLKSLFSPSRHPELDSGSSQKDSAGGTTTKLDSSLRWNDNMSDEQKTPGPGTCILDVGTGSGCIAITAALELPDTFVQACDIDAKCLETAGLNAEKLGANVHVYESDLLSHVGACDILLCNLPYVPDDFAINTAATHEPKHALFGGKDGLDMYRTMFDQIEANDWKPRYILTESLPPQHTELAGIAKAVGFALSKTDDFIQLFELK
ncbi:MAG: HemK/PrmC family methyltransferase [Candidatus Saccharibacteria bacterium]